MTAAILALLQYGPRLLAVVAEWARNRQLITAGAARAYAEQMEASHERMAKAGAARARARARYHADGVQRDDPYRID